MTKLVISPIKSTIKKCDRPQITFRESGGFNLNSSFTKGESNSICNLNAKSAKFEKTPNNYPKFFKVIRTDQIEGASKIYATRINTLPEFYPVAPEGRRKREGISRKGKSKIKRAIKRIYKLYGYVNMITLTQKDSIASNGYQFRAMFDLFLNRLRKYIKRKCGIDVFDYVWKIEPQPENGNLHIHLCIGQYIPKKWINENWNKAQLETFKPEFISAERCNRYYANMVLENRVIIEDEARNISQIKGLKFEDVHLSLKEDINKGLSNIKLEKWITLSELEIERYKWEIKQQRKEREKGNDLEYTLISFPHVGNMNSNKSGSYIYKTSSGKELGDVNECAEYVSKDIFEKDENTGEVNYPEYIKGNIFGISKQLSKDLEITKSEIGILSKSEINDFVFDIKKILDKTKELYFDYQNKHTETNCLWVADGVYLKHIINKELPAYNIAQNIAQKPPQQPPPDD